MKTLLVLTLALFLCSCGDSIDAPTASGKPEVKELKVNPLAVEIGVINVANKEVDVYNLSANRVEMDETTVYIISNEVTPFDRNLVVFLNIE